MQSKRIVATSLSLIATGFFLAPSASSHPDSDCQGPNEPAECGFIAFDTPDTPTYTPQQLCKMFLDKNYVPAQVIGTSDIACVQQAEVVSGDQVRGRRDLWMLKSRDCITVRQTEERDILPFFARRVDTTDPFSDWWLVAYGA